jgi:hypothetical protein
MTIAKYKHELTQRGIKIFEDLALTDIFNALTNDEMDEITFKITIGRHEIEIPNTADNFEDLIYFLKETLKKEEEEQC